MNNAERIRELEGRIVAICVQCQHSHFVTGRYECTVNRSHCHSKRVRKWLDEIKKLEGEDDGEVIRFRGKVRPGKVRRGRAWHSMARQGK